MIVSRGQKPLAEIEIKSTTSLHPGDLKGLKASLGEHQKAMGFVIEPFQLRRELEEGIQAVLGENFLLRISNNWDELLETSCKS